MNSRKYIYYIPSIIWASFVLILSIMPSDDIPELWMDFFIEPDKFAHFLFYSTLSFLYSYTIKKSNSLSRLSALKVLIIFITVFSFGIAIELLQLIIFASRTGELYDVLANFLGTLAGISVYLWIHSKVKFL